MHQPLKEQPWLEVLERKVDLARLEILELHVPQVEPFRSAIAVRNERQALFVRWWNRQGEWGIGECSCRPDPFFSGEFVSGARAILKDYVLPLLPRQGTVGQVVEALRRIRGWPFTTSTVLDALFDLGRRQGLPDPLDLWPGERIDRIPVGISLGLFESPEQAVERVERAVADGYRRVKLKIAPTMNRDTLKAIRLAYPDLHIGLDANGSCTADDMDFLIGLAELKPSAVEQPFAPRRLDLCTQLKKLRPDLRICLDESLDDIGTLVSASELGALDEVNIKPGRIGGSFQVCDFLDFCAQSSLPAWVGGMFETGVGRLANLRVAARLPEAEAHDLSPSSRYFTCDVSQQPISMDADGTIDLSDDSPVDLDLETMAELTVDRLELQAA